MSSSDSGKQVTVNRMAKRVERKHLRFSGPRAGQGATNPMLEIFFAWDRMVVEFSMLRYSVSRRDRNLMRKQNQAAALCFQRTPASAPSAVSKPVLSCLACHTKQRNICWSVRDDDSPSRSTV